LENNKYIEIFTVKILFVLIAARGTRNSQSARQTIGVRFSTDNSHAPAARLPTPRTLRTAFSDASAATATAATTAVRRGRVFDDSRA